MQVSVRSVGVEPGYLDNRKEAEREMHGAQGSNNNCM